jgi:hypothetical protein
MGYLEVMGLRLIRTVAPTLITLATTIIFSMLTSLASAQTITFFSIFGGSGTDRGLSIASDGSYIYISGHSTSFSATRDAILTIFRASDNSHLCSVRIDLGGEEFGYFVGVSGNQILVIGQTGAGPNSRNIFIARFNFDGDCSSFLSPLIRVYDLGGDEFVRGGTIDGGAGYVTGYIRSQGPFLMRFDIASLDAEWAVVWNTGNPGDQAFSVTTLGGDVYVTGKTAGDDVLVSKFDGLGNHIMTTIYSSPLFEEGSSITAYGSSIFVAGSVEVTTGNRDQLVMRLDPSTLDVIWAKAIGTDSYESAIGVTIWGNKVVLVGDGRKLDINGDFLVSAVGQIDGDLSFSVALHHPGTWQQGFAASTQNDCIITTGFTRNGLTTSLLSYPATAVALTYTPSTVTPTVNTLTPQNITSHITPTLSSIAPVFNNPQGDDVIYFKLCPNAMTFATTTTTTVTETNTTTMTTTATTTTTIPTTITTTATEITTTTATIRRTILTTSTKIVTNTEIATLTTTSIIRQTELTKITETITSYTTLTHTIPRTTYLTSYYTETTTIAHLTTQTKTTTTTRLLTSTSIVESTKTVVKEEMLLSPYTLILFILLGLAIGVVSTMLLYRKK